MKKLSAILSRKEVKRYLAVFCALAIMCALIPFSHDDWGWGSSKGLELLASGFQDYGGRYLGYLISIVVTRSAIVRGLYMASITLGIAILVEKIVKSEWAFWLSLLSIFLLPPNSFKGSFVWLSSFVNYFTSAFVFLIFINRAIKVIKGEEVNNSKITTISYFILGIAGSLIVEHMTLCCVIVPLLVAIYLKATKQKQDKAILAFFAGATLGAICMFINPTYRKVAAGNDKYRNIADDGLIGRIVSNSAIIYKYAYLRNIFMDLLLFVPCLIFLAKNKTSKKENRLIAASSVIVLFSIIYSILTESWDTDISDMNNIFIFGELMLSALAVISLLYLIYLVVKKSETTKAGRVVYMLFLFSAAVSIAPLFIIHPIGSRCFILAYIMYLLLACFLISKLVKPAKKSKNESIITPKNTLILTTTSIFAIYLVVFAVSKYDDIRRINYVWEQINAGQTDVKLRSLPFKQFYHFSNPSNQNHENYFRDYYGIPDNINLQYAGKKEDE